MSLSKRKSPPLEKQEIRIVFLAQIQQILLAQKMIVNPYIQIHKQVQKDLILLTRGVVLTAETSFAHRAYGMGCKQP